MDLNERVRARPALRRFSVLLRYLNRIALVVLREDVGGQGRHFDPNAPATELPSRTRWTAPHRKAFESSYMELFRSALRPAGGGTERDGVIGDLADFHGLTSEEVVERCLEWEDTSVEEWEAAPRDSADGLAHFYDTVHSWSFDLLWYAYLQSVGYGYPETVVVADRVGSHPGGGRMLDLGSGAGVTAQLFAALGYEVTLADVSKPLLEFARFRLDGRGVNARYVHLPEELSADAYDLVTALDVMAHVPDLDDTVARLHRSLRSGGLLVANFDVRRRSRHNAWHLYEDDLPLRWAVERGGFVPVTLIDGILWIYRAVPMEGRSWRRRTAWAWVRLASPPAQVVRRLRRVLARAALVTVYSVLGARRRSEDLDRAQTT